MNRSTHFLGRLLLKLARLISAPFVASAILFEILARVLLKRELSRLKKTQVFNARTIHPYWMNGEFYYGPLEERDEREGPAVYGYHEQPAGWLFDFSRPVTSIADRGDFLFHDRAAIANDTKSENVTRIFVLGGSVATGMGTADVANRWFLVLERLLSEEMGVNVSIIPAACSGFVSTQERLVLDFLVLPRQPDAVIALHGFNDAFIPALNGVRPGDPQAIGVEYKNFYSSLNGIRQWVARNSQIYDSLYREPFLKTLENNCEDVLLDPDRFRNYVDSVVSVYFDNLKAMNRRCCVDEAPFIAFLQPCRLRTVRLLKKEENLSPLERLGGAAFDAICQRAKRETRYLPIIDVSDCLHTQEDLDSYRDFVHCEAHGQHTLATALLPYMKQLLGAIKANDKQRSVK